MHSRHPARRVRERCRPAHENTAQSIRHIHVCLVPYTCVRHGTVCVASRVRSLSTGCLQPCACPLTWPPRLLRWWVTSTTGRPPTRTGHSRTSTACGSCSCPTSPTARPPLRTSGSCGVCIDGSWWVHECVRRAGALPARQARRHARHYAQVGPAECALTVRSGCTNVNCVWELFLPDKPDGTAAITHRWAQCKAHWGGSKLIAPGGVFGACLGNGRGRTRGAYASSGTTAAKHRGSSPLGSWGSAKTGCRRGDSA